MPASASSVPAPRPEDFYEGGRLDVKSLAIYIWDVLHTSFRNQSDPLFPPHVDANCSYPLFVTFTQYDHVDQSDEDGNLRGCIGCLEEIKMSETSDYVRKAAFYDNRFAAIKERDVDSLAAQMSILHTFEKVDRVLDWEFGTHGIVIEFAVGHRGYSATYLPEVVDDNFRNHGKEHCITELVRFVFYFSFLQNEKLRHWIRFQNPSIITCERLEGSRPFSSPRVGRAMCGRVVIPTTFTKRFVTILEKICSVKNSEKLFGA